VADEAPSASHRELGSTELKRLHRDWRRRVGSRLALVLDGVQGPFNVGAIYRTAAAFRVERVWLTEHATGPEHPKVAKTALGSDRFVTTSRVGDPAATVEAARGAGYRVIGIELASDATPLFEIDLRRDVALVIGHEDHGISRAALAACDDVAFVPQFGRIGSLNVATAASLAMYEWARQQLAADQSRFRTEAERDSDGA
jgi:tRNA (guanosine-2'-O-)-methyltransferase